MVCEHKRIKCVNCEFSCMDCGEKLPPDFLAKKEEPQEQPKKRTRKGVKE